MPNPREQLFKHCPVCNQALKQGEDNMSKFVSLGSVPCNEPCVCVGEEGYRERALDECQRFVELLRRTFGPEPDGAQLQVRSFDCDLGTYYEVVCWFDASITEALAYALHCESDTPTTWDGEDCTSGVGSRTCL